MPEIKPFTQYVCPVGAGQYGHSSLWSGSYEVERLKRPSDGICVCGTEMVDQATTKDGHRYRLVFESIDPQQADGMERAYGWDVWPTLDEDGWASLRWHEISKEAETAAEITAQYETLLAWAESHEQPIRNVRLLQSSTSVEWEPVDG